MRSTQHRIRTGAAREFSVLIPLFRASGRSHRRFPAGYQARRRSRKQWWGHAVNEWIRIRMRIVWVGADLNLSHSVRYRSLRSLLQIRITISDSTDSSPSIVVARNQKWVGADLNRRPPPCQGGVITELDYQPLEAFLRISRYPGNVIEPFGSGSDTAIRSPSLRRRREESRRFPAAFDRFY